MVNERGDAGFGMEGCPRDVDTEQGAREYLEVTAGPSWPLCKGSLARETSRSFGQQ